MNTKVSRFTKPHSQLHLCELYGKRFGGYLHLEQAGTERGSTVLPGFPKTGSKYWTCWTSFTTDCSNTSSAALSVSAGSKSSEGGDCREIRWRVDSRESGSGTPKQ